ncbi:CYIR protein [Plasmodium cynomolgi strain B]|uniref:CYIR protein n=1 Tax=Plasmodium cynomolgi (strain B) TaxID=1120755 RepID=K6UP02_PLACD|nr:CYIR protein [Plasmodium cynomolgi strain B]GAB69963.1 CYIR protein [Plasmodium cynomolgi strain B]
MNMFKNISETNYDSNVLEKFLKVQDTFFKEKKYYGCKYAIKTKNFEYYQEMNDKKDLYDYFSNYNTIRKNIEYESGPLDTFEEYVKHIKQLYDKYKVNCLDHFDYWLSDCPYYFKREDEYDPQIFLSKLDCYSKNSKDNRMKNCSVKSVTKKKMTFYYLKCKDNIEQKPIMCALVPVTMEYIDDKVEDKMNDKAVRKGIPKPPDPWSTFGGVLHSDQLNSEFLTEADGVSPYLVLTDDEIKWKILDNERFDCERYGSKDTYGLCKHLKNYMKKEKLN